MGLYLTKAKFTEDSLSAMTEHPSNRLEAVKRLIEGFDGKLLHFYWVFGESDVIFVFEAPNHETSMSILLSFSSRGALKSQETTTLLSNDEAMRAMKRPGTIDTGYKSPKQEWEGRKDEGGEAG